MSSFKYTSLNVMDDLHTATSKVYVIVVLWVSIAIGSR